jgi:rubrerythrin
MLAGGAGAGAAELLAGCGGGGGRTLPTPNPAQTQADAALVSALIEAERTAIAAYRLGLPRLTGAARVVAARFLGHEQEHERALTREIVSLGVRPPIRRSQASYAAGFPRLSSAESALRLALDVENTQIAGYYNAIGTVTTSALRATLASILGTEAEHMAVILGELHEPQAPGAIVAGSKPT